jgi:hypothetical protein
LTIINQVISGTIYEIASGDVQDFIAKFRVSQPGDVILLEPGVYNFLDVEPECYTECYTDYFTGEEVCYEDCIDTPYDIGEYAPSWETSMYDEELDEYIYYNDLGMIIRGTGTDPTETGKYISAGNIVIQ